MKKIIFALALVACAARRPLGAAELEVNADRVIGDRATEALVASGNVVAVSKPYSMRADFLERDENGVYHFTYPTKVSTCTNDFSELHWCMTGEVEYRTSDYLLLRNMWVEMFGLPVLYLPYFYYPLDTDYGFRWMPGYTSDWGAYLLTKYIYHLAGDREHKEGSFWLRGGSGVDFRTEQGIAYGQSFKWGLGDFGTGKFKAYYAWDHSDKDKDANGHHSSNLNNWQSTIPDNRYGFSLEHRWEATERDVLRVRGERFSDSRFKSDFFCNNSITSLRRQWFGYDGNEFAWEHRENPFGLGLSVSGPLDDFISGVSRLPEVYIDLNPTPVWKLPINYETENRAGYLERQPAKLGRKKDGVTVYNRNPAVWAEYETFRFDTYHRLTAPFKVADALSIVPRVGFHGTYWDKTGLLTEDPMKKRGNSEDSIFRSIIEGGVTFAGRGVGRINNEWLHVVEPYLDVLLQEASYSGDSEESRPYVFDSIDMSQDWSDQFAGRSRNLPYTYYGITPGLRNQFRKLNENGKTRTIFDLDFYAAIQFNGADFYGTDELHRLAENGDPNYDGLMIVPGVRAMWKPTSKTQFACRIEYNSDDGDLALGDVSFRDEFSEKFSYYVNFTHREYRFFDFASRPYDKTLQKSDEFNRAYFSYVTVGCEYELCDAVVISPCMRWDTRYNELDTVGGWIDFRTDCLGFRFLLEYENDFRYIDGEKSDSDFSFGFFVYLRAVGPSTGSVFED